ncbi:MAG: hypothetical protein Kow0056_07630 [Coriobacteriia bacterium]
MSRSSAHSEEPGPIGSAGQDAVRQRVVRVPDEGAIRRMLGGMLGARAFTRRRRIEGPALIEALHGVVAAAASAVDVDDALSAIVEQAKRVTDTDKAVLCILVDEPEGLRVDAETVVARGSREELPQHWWSRWVESLADEAVGQARVVVQQDREESAWIAVAPATARGGPIGVLCAMNTADRAFSPDETSFLGILSAFAATVIENAKLYEQSRLALLASERDRIAREMHDGLAQTLFSASLGLEVAMKRLQRDPDEAADRILEVQKMVTDGLAELRSYIYDLRSPRLQRYGLAEAIERYLEDVTAGKEREGRLSVIGKQRRLTEAAEGCLYQVAREAITNAVRHSGCSSILVTIEYGPDEVTLTVRDDGDGFDVKHAFRAASKRGSLGLRNIRDRVTALGGRADVASSPGSGTYVRVRLPD